MLRQLTPHYTRLGVAPTVTRAQLSAAYRAAALKHHPDRGGKASTFAAIRESYEVLLTHLNRTRTYQPASLRSFRSSSQDRSGFWGIFFSVLAPTAVGLVLGVRLMYTGNDRKGLRAGGTSRFRIPDSHDFALQHEFLPEEKGLQIITTEEQCMQHQYGQKRTEIPQK